MFVRVSRRRSVTMFPFVVTVHSANVRETIPLSFVVTDASDDLDDMSFDPSCDFAQAPKASTASTDPAAMPTTAFFFIALFLSFGVPTPGPYAQSERQYDSARMLMQC